MATEFAICSGCGARISVDGFGKCGCCGLIYSSVDKIVEEYNRAYMVDMDDLLKGVDVDPNENRATAGDVYIKLGEYDSALEHFDRLSRECPYDCRVWWGLVRVNTRSFTEKEMSRFRLAEIDAIYARAYTTANDEKRAEMAKEYHPYYNEVRAWQDDLTNNIDKKIKKLKDDIAIAEHICDRNIESLEKKIERRDTLRFFMRLMSAFGIVIGAALFFIPVLFITEVIKDIYLTNFGVWSFMSMGVMLVLVSIVSMSAFSSRNRLTQKLMRKKMYYKEHCEDIIISAECKIRDLQDKVIEINTWQ